MFLCSHILPVELARLCVRHLRQIFLPGDWHFQIGSDRMAALRATLFSLLSVLMFSDLVWRQGGRKRVAWGAVGVYIAVMTFSCPPFQAIVRHLYLFNGPLSLLAFDFIVRALNLIKAQTASSTIMWSMPREADSQFGNDTDDCRPVALL